MAEPTERSELAPLSFQQEEMLENICQHPDCAHKYDVVNLFRLDGQVDVAALAAAVDDVTRRHAALRTTIRWLGDELVQQVHPTPVCPVEVTERAAGSIDELVAELVSARYGRDEILDGRPLSRPRVVRMAGTTLLAWTVHHLMTDGRSMAQIWRDLSDCYAARIRGDKPELPPLPMSYADFARAQRAKWPGLAPAVVAYWKDRLTAHQGPVPWPAPPVPGPPGANEVVRTPVGLPKAIEDAVRRAAAELRVSPFLVILGGVAAAINELTGQGVVMLGTDTENREDPAKERLVGHLVNTIFVLANPGGAGSFHELMRDIRDQWLDAERYRDAYSGQVLRALGWPAWTRVNMYHVRPDELLAPELEGVNVTPVPTAAPARDWRDLMVLWEVHNGRVGGVVQFRPASVDPRAVDTLIGIVQRILRNPFAWKS
jgi:hypothetical protein